MRIVDVPPEWHDLPGTFTLTFSDSHFDAMMRNASVLLVEHDISLDAQPHSVRYAAYIWVQRALLEDGAAISGLLRAVDPRIRPWLYSDRYHWPAFDDFLFPHLTRVLRWLRAHRSIAIIRANRDMRSENHES